MRPELDLNDPETRRQRIERLSRLGTSPAEHTYLHATIDDAVSDLQSYQLLWVLMIAVQSILVVVLIVAMLLLLLLR